MFVLSSPASASADRHLHALVSFMGLHAEVLTDPDVAIDRATGGTHIVTTCEALHSFCLQPHGLEWLRNGLARSMSSLFVTGVTPSSASLDAISAVAPGAIRRIVPVDGPSCPYVVGKNQTGALRYFAGLSFGSAAPATDCAFALAETGQDISTLVTVADRPCYVAYRSGSMTCHVVGTSRVLDVDEPLPRGRQPLERFLEFAPLVAHLKDTFGAQCWHNEQQSACFVIDDPLLRRRYGFLNFDDLESQLTRLRASASIAFIPWNYSRSDPQVAAKFKQPDRRLSLSVHGCDHTGGEFGSTDVAWLEGQARLGLARMDAHQRLTGVPYSRIMVFPQGVFSRASLKALASAGLMAAVNSTPYAVDAEPADVTYREVLGMAVTSYTGVPLLVRHYPGKHERLALDLLLGRQVILVEHHEYFRDGCEPAMRSVRFLNDVAPELRWTDLEDLFLSAHMVREDTANLVYVQVQGTVSRLQNPTSQTRHLRVTSTIDDPSVTAATWNGRGVTCAREASELRCELELGPHEQGLLRFLSPVATTVPAPHRPAVRRRVAVSVRRYLSEFRDNHVSRSETLSRLAKNGRRLLHGAS